MSNFCINTERLTIRKFETTDWEDLSEILTDERRIVAFADAVNERSWKLLEALGMRNEGKMKKYTFKHRDENGEPIWQDMLIFALLKEEA